MCASYSKLSKELKNGIEILVGQAVFKVMDQNSQKVVWINNSRTAWNRLVHHQNRYLVTKRLFPLVNKFISCRKLSDIALNSKSLL